MNKLDTLTQISAVLHFTVTVGSIVYFNMRKMFYVL
jgi:hypothetical protein